MFDNELAELELVELDAAGTLAAAEANEHALITAETRRLQIAAHWADLHPGEAVVESRLRGTEHAVRLGGEGTPTVGDFAATELGCVLRMSDGAAARLIGDALDLRHRLPLIWAAAQAGQAPAYQARSIAKATRHLGVEQAVIVDQQIAPSLVRLGSSSEHGLKLIIARATVGDAIWFKATVDRIAEILAEQGDTDPAEVRRSKAIGILAQPGHACSCCANTKTPTGTDPPNHPISRNQQKIRSRWNRPRPRLPARPPIPSTNRPDKAGTGRRPMGDPTSEANHLSLQILPPQFDPKRARPRAVVYVHLSAEALTGGTGIARVEDVGPILLSRLRLLFGGDCTINLKPVIDLPAGHIPVDAYEIPASLREQLLLRNPADVFPYAAAVSRPIDVDHTVPYLSPDRGGPPGQTWLGNLGLQVRRHHRLKTHGGWQVRQPEPGTWLWRSPRGRIYLVNATGTHPLSDTEFAEAIWRAASPPHALVS